MTLTVCSANVNGVRAAARRGGVQWLSDNHHDLVLLQEVRANNEQLRESVAELGYPHIAHAPSDQAGRAGVAVLSSSELRDVQLGLGEEFANSGRWVEATADTALGPVTAVSVYVHTGEADTPKQEEKYRFLAAMGQRLGELRERGAVVVAGDFNIAHTERDIRNAKGNRGKAGYLPEEQAYLTQWLESGWVDLGRLHAGDVDGPYTWWTWRGQAFDRDVGWRIDYLFATPDLAKSLADVRVGRAPSYAERWSDHAPVTAVFQP